MYVNLFEETLWCMNSHGYECKDVHGVTTSAGELAWQDYKDIATQTDYEQMPWPSSTFVDKSMCVVLNDKSWLSRGDVGDGLEGWVFNQPQDYPDRGPSLYGKYVHGRDAVKDAIRGGAR